MFAKTAQTITRKLQENNSISSDQYEICRFGFQQGLTILLNAVTVIVIGVILGMVWQALLFMLLYSALRSNAGGFHAQTATRCYAYSILLMVAVLLAMKHLFIPTFICIITLMISCTIILILAPVEDLNKPLDNIEHVTYRRRTYIITATESVVFIISLLFNAMQISLCIMWVFLMIGMLLFAGVISLSSSQIKPA